ncbi:MAG: hypothetical protein JXR96_29785, partial [Deltaproteobacteria bacterium]|nr:hypothetical protein [Deltaproteobacteria bacterium]
QVPGSDWTAVDTGNNHTCGLKSSGTLWCWGWNHHGQLGLGSDENRDTPARVSGSGWQSVSAGNHHSCAIETDGTPRCWGGNSQGQLGDGSAWEELPVDCPSP